jgi:putative phage-type endonuclease
MITHNVVQGEPSWHQLRKQFYPASEASAVLGASPYKTRSQLLHERSTGIVPDVDAGTQRRFDDGHRFEALARQIAEKILDEDLYPVVGTNGNLLASFDGLTMDESVVFEHKTLNNDIRQAMHPGCTGEDLPLHYRIQLEQQLAVSGAKYALFMASSWDGDSLLEERHCIYEPDIELRERIMQGWAQFEIDLREYQPQAIEVKPIGRTPETLPALHIAVTGMVTASNLAEFKAHALAMFDGIITELVTDEDFADAEKAVKWCGEVEDRLAAAKQHALSQTRDIDELFRTIDDIMAESKRRRLDLDKLVKSRKEAMKTKIVTDARMALGQHIAALNDRLGGQPLMPAICADFAGVIKGKKNFDSMRDAVNTMLAAAKVDANIVAERIQANLATLKERESFGFLFSDVPVIVLKQPDDLKLLVESRISNYRVAEAAKTAAAEEARAAKRRQEEESARIEAEDALKAASAVQQPVAPPAAMVSAAANQVSILVELNALLVRLSDSQIERVLHFVQSRYGAELGIDADAAHQDRTSKPGYRTSGPRKIAA